MKQRLHRLLRLTPREVRERAGQGCRQVGGAAPRAAASLAALRGGATDRVPAGSPFPGSLADTMKALDTHAPGARARLVASAEACLAGRFDLLGYEGLSFGEPMDWHLDPVSGRRAPLAHWSRIDPLDVEVVGDSKVIWELNRHQWLVRVAQAYGLTGDERYAEACVGHIEAWIDSNPPGIGINWASSLEVAFRLISWCWTLQLLRDRRLVPCFGTVF